MLPTALDCTARPVTTVHPTLLDSDLAAAPSTTVADQ